VRTSGRAQVRKRKDVRTDVDDQNLGNGWVDPRELVRLSHIVGACAASPPVDADCFETVQDRMGRPLKMLFLRGQKFTL
jgi:hypothetical protein